MIINKETKVPTMPSTLLFFSAVLMLVSVLASPAYADDHDHDDEEQVHHYTAQKPKNAKAAMQLQKDSARKIDAILEKKTLDGADLEKIHEISYSLEAAVDELRKAQNTETEPLLDAFDEATQALHYASENHDEKKTRHWFTELKKASGKLSNHF